MHEKFMRLAIDQAQIAERGGDLPFGAVIVKDDEIISSGQSREQCQTDVTAHAEMEAVSKACRQLGLNLSECTIYTTCEPCIMCAAAIFQAKVLKVVIGAQRKDVPEKLRPRAIGIYEVAEDSSHQVEIKTGVLRKQCIDLLARADFD